MNARRVLSGIAILGLLASLPRGAGAEPPPSPPKDSSHKTPAEDTLRPDVCALLTASDIEAVQRERAKAIQPSARPSGAFLMSQCLYLLPAFDRSVNVTLITAESARPDASTPRRFWQERFHPRPAKGAPLPRILGEEGDKESGPPRSVPGLGEEAFWQGNRLTGALYVLQKDAIVRLSLGGDEDEAAKIEKSKTLALKALPRLDRVLGR